MKPKILSLTAIIFIVATVLSSCQMFTKETKSLQGQNDTLNQADTLNNQIVTDSLQSLQIEM